MGNCAPRLADAAPEQMSTLIARPSATPSEMSNSHTALEECLPSGQDVALGDRSGAGSSTEQKSEYFSPRMDEMMRSKSQFSSNVEHEIEHSRVHWSEVPGLFDLSGDNNDHEYEEVDRENREVFAELVTNLQWRHHECGHFFREWPSTWKLGRKIAEGGQAAIFEVTDDDGNIDTDCLLKVFKRGSRLSDLTKQWPHGILRGQVGTCIAFMGTMFDDARFAFLMVRCWGDLRMLIDQAMQENNQGPPFPYEWKGETLYASHIMIHIASQMADLHSLNIIHRDLKASNILLHTNTQGILIVVADYECAIGVVGTGFWRAPELLLALENRTALDFSEKVDVYSFGMTCFEVVTGRLPFEGELDDCRASRDLVIAGRRPKLPSDLDGLWKDLIESCWNPIQNDRPSFAGIVNALKALLIDGVSL